MNKRITPTHTIPMIPTVVKGVNEKNEIIASAKNTPMIAIFLFTRKSMVIIINKITAIGNPNSFVHTFHELIVFIVRVLRIYLFPVVDIAAPTA